MNRRDFLKRIAAAGLVAATPEILIPERKFWQLDRTMAAPKVWGDGVHDDTAAIQWYIDRAEKIPFRSNYTLKDSLYLRDGGDFILEHPGTRFVGDHEGPMLYVDLRQDQGRTIDLGGAQFVLGKAASAFAWKL